MLCHPRRFSSTTILKTSLFSIRKAMENQKRKLYRTTPCIIAHSNRVCEFDTNKVIIVAFGWKVLWSYNRVLVCCANESLPPMRACDGQELMHGAGVKHCLPLSNLAAGRRVIGILWSHTPLRHEFTGKHLS